MELALRSHIKDPKLSCSLDQWSSVTKKYSGDAVVRRKFQNTSIEFIVKTWDLSGDYMNESMIRSEANAYKRIERLRELDLFTMNIPKFYGFVECPNNDKSIITEWVGDVTFKDHMQNKSEKEWIGILYDLTQTIMFLERIGINHRDLHPLNIHVLGEDLKVFDFGLSLGTSFHEEKGWTTELWGNLFGESLGEHFVRGYDLHYFFASCFMAEHLWKGLTVPKKIVDELFFPCLKNITDTEQLEHDRIDSDGPSYREITSNNVTKLVHGNLLSDWTSTTPSEFLKRLDIYVLDIEN